MTGASTDTDRIIMDRDGEPPLLCPCVQSKKRRERSHTDTEGANLGKTETRRLKQSRETCYARISVGRLGRCIRLLRLLIVKYLNLGGF